MEFPIEDTTTPLRPIEVVQVIPNDFTVHQAGNVMGTFALSTFITPLAVRALARNFGVEWGYWKAVRTTFAIRMAAYALLPGGYTLPASKGKMLSEKLKAKFETKTGDLPPRRRTPPPSPGIG